MGGLVRFPVPLGSHRGGLQAGVHDGCVLVGREREVEEHHGGSGLPAGLDRQLIGPLGRHVALGRQQDRQDVIGGLVPARRAAEPGLTGRRDTRIGECRIARVQQLPVQRLHDGRLHFGADHQAPRGTGPTRPPARRLADLTDRRNVVTPGALDRLAQQVTRVISGRYRSVRAHLATCLPSLAIALSAPSAGHHRCNASVCKLWVRAMSLRFCDVATCLAPRKVVVLSSRNVIFR
jgi:hypothetical protein